MQVLGKRRAANLHGDIGFFSEFLCLLVVSIQKKETALSSLSLKEQLAVATSRRRWSEIAYPPNFDFVIASAARLRVREFLGSLSKIGITTIKAATKQASNHRLSAACFLLFGGCFADTAGPQVASSYCVLQCMVNLAPQRKELQDYNGEFCYCFQ